VCVQYTPSTVSSSSGNGAGAAPLNLGQCGANTVKGQHPGDPRRTKTGRAGGQPPARVAASRSSASGVDQPPILASPQPSSQRACWVAAAVRRGRQRTSSRPGSRCPSSRIRTEIAALYAAHPGIATFTTQDVQYSAASRDTVLRECTSGTGSQDTETGQIIALRTTDLLPCTATESRPRVPAAVAAAGQLYWYAVTHIAGPASAKTSLDEILQELEAARTPA